MRLLKILSVAGVVLSTATAMSAQAGHENKAEIPTQSCFWTGPYVKENPVTNIAFPDAGAAYWGAKYTLPEGANLELIGRYPKARYMSFNSYDANGENPTYAPVDVIRDVEIKPFLSFAKNPYIPGNKRNTFLRGYKINVASGMPQADDNSNTLRTSVMDGEQAVLLHRIYVPDEGNGVTGGEYLPYPILTLANGTLVYEEDKVCAELQAVNEYIEPPIVPVEKYLGVLKPGGQNYWTSQGFAPFGIAPATEENPVSLRKAFFPQVNIACDYFFSCDYEGPQNNGYYANIDNSYTYAYISNAPKSFIPVPKSQTRPLGLQFTVEAADPDLAVTVFKGKLPATPTTLKGDEIMTEGSVRYWSFCTNEYYSQKVTDCIYDEQVVVDKEGYYTIAISWADDRPTNATNECGVNWLSMADSGDGFGDMVGNSVLNNPHESMVIIRNMTPSEDFMQAIQNIPSQTTTAETLGEFNTTYYQTSVAEFEAKGCQ